MTTPIPFTAYAQEFPPSYSGRIPLYRLPAGSAVPSTPVNQLAAPIAGDYVPLVSTVTPATPQGVPTGYGGYIATPQNVPTSYGGYVVDGEGQQLPPPAPTTINWSSVIFWGVVLLIGWTIFSHVFLKGGHR